MKSIVLFRRTSLLCLLFIVSLSACKKQDGMLTPDLAARVAGNYKFSEAESGGKTYPGSQTNLKGGVVVTRETATTVSIELDFQIKSTGETYIEDSADNVTVTEASGGKIEYRYNGKVIARGTSNTIIVEGDGPDDIPIKLTSAK